ncbi:MAG: CARDB domain-containing protein [Kiloniellaceae bacterium]
MKQSLNRGLAALLAATALTVSLAADPAAAQVQPRPQGPAGSTVLTSHLPDIIPTSLGFVMKSGPVSWGATVVLDNPAQADATRVGPQKDLCRFYPAAYRTHNKGDGDAGAFVTKTYVGATLVETHNVPGGLAAKTGIDWHKFTVDLKEGMNVIRVVFDANKQVAETDENNTYSIRVNVKIDCDGDGKIGGVATPVGGLKKAPGTADPDPVQPRSLRLKPAN